MAGGGTAGRLTGRGGVRGWGRGGRSRCIQRSSSAALVHRGDCALYPAEGGFLTREEAMIALAEPDIEACQICKPETGLVDG
ncbi:DUF6233 domain-containing protein [Streptomyces sp. NPDC001890]|uniref:DUF6233 domain-containing protein n=1 Tax=Streptomyces sp. NPDC001890 TaxID=3364620 RepID=UPI0036B77008